MAIETGFLVAILFGKVRREGTGALIRKGHGWTLIRGRRLFKEIRYIPSCVAIS